MTSEEESTTLRALITGINGIVGKYLVEEIRENGYSVSGIGMGPFALCGVQYKDVNITEWNKLEMAVEEIDSNVVFHLAGISSVLRQCLLRKESKRRRFNA